MFVLEGGLGKTFANRSSVGLAYQAVWQTTNASGADVPMELFGRKIRGFGLGPEVGLMQSRLPIRALWEFGMRNNLEGFVVVGSLALPF